MFFHFQVIEISGACYVIYIDEAMKMSTIELNVFQKFHNGLTYKE
jgi:hypothetical protein